MTDIWRAIRTSTDQPRMRRWFKPEMVEMHGQSEAFRRDQLTREAVEMIYPQEKPKTHWLVTATGLMLAAFVFVGFLMWASSK